MFTSRIVKYFEKVTQREGIPPSLGVFKTQLIKVLNNLLWTESSIRWTPDIPLNLNYSMNTGVVWGWCGGVGGREEQEVLFRKRNLIALMKIAC